MPRRLKASGGGPAQGLKKGHCQESRWGSAADSDRRFPPPQNRRGASIMKGSERWRPWSDEGAAGKPPGGKTPAFCPADLDHRRVKRPTPVNGCCEPPSRTPSPNRFWLPMAAPVAAGKRLNLMLYGATGRGEKKKTFPRVHASPSCRKSEKGPCFANEKPPAPKPAQTNPRRLPPNSGLMLRSLRTGFCPVQRARRGCCFDRPSIPTVSPPPRSTAPSRSAERPLPRWGGKKVATVADVRISR